MNATYRAAEQGILVKANEVILDCDFVFTYDDENGDEQPYDFSAQDGLFLDLLDKKDGKLLKRWTHAGGLTLVDNTIRWNEPDDSEMDFPKGRLYYRVGYFLDDYTPDDIEIELAFGEAKVI